MHVAYIRRTLAILFGMGRMAGGLLLGEVISISVLIVVVFRSIERQRLYVRTSTACRSMTVVTCGVGQEKGNYQHYA